MCFLVIYVTTLLFALALICLVSSPCPIIYHRTKGPGLVHCGIVTSLSPHAHNNEIKLSPSLKGTVSQFNSQAQVQSINKVDKIFFFVSLHSLNGISVEVISENGNLLTKIPGYLVVFYTKTQGLARSFLDTILEMSESVFISSSSKINI